MPVKVRRFQTPVDYSLAGYVATAPWFNFKFPYGLKYCAMLSTVRTVKGRL